MTSFYKEQWTSPSSTEALPLFHIFVETVSECSPTTCQTTFFRSLLEITPQAAGLTMLELGGQGAPLHKKYKIYLDRVGVAKVPEEYESRLTEIFRKTFKHLRLFALDPYDLALSKLERNIQRDRDDVLHLARIVPFDLEALKERYQKELRWQLGNPEREDLSLRLWIEAIGEERSQ